MLKEGDIVYITLTEWGRMPTGMIGARGRVLHKSATSFNPFWTGEHGEVWAVDIPGFGVNRFHELELTKLCKKD